MNKLYTHAVIKRILGGIVFSLLCSVSLYCQTVTTLAGSITTPTGSAIDASGNVYVIDNAASGEIKKITPGGSVSSYSNPGSYASPPAICIDASGNLYVADGTNGVIQKVSTGSPNSPTVYAGVAGNNSYLDGAIASAEFVSPNGICIDPSGNLYVTEASAYAIRKITPTTVSTFAGDYNTSAYTDATGSSARFQDPQGLCSDLQGNIYVADNGGSRVRKITPAGVVTTFANGISNVRSLVADAQGFIYASGSNSIYKISPSGAASVVYVSSGLSSPNALSIKSDTILYVADFGNNRVAEIHPPDPTVILTSTGTTTAYAWLVKNGYTYYSEPSAPNNIVFAIKKNGATVTNDTASIEALASLFSSSSTNGVNKEHASYLMKRSWNMSGSIAGGPVTVRFYYDPADSAAVITQRNADSVSIKTGNPSSLLLKTAFQWFKTVGVPYNSGWRSSIVGNKFPSTHTKLTPAAYGVENSINYVEFSVSSFSGGTGGAGFGPPGAGGGAVGLPVTWAGFDVKSVESGNELTWKTASEKNASYFDIEYSHDAKSFESVGVKIPAAGNSATMNTYTFQHADFSSYVYYRIKQVDLDDRTDYSETKMVKRAADPTFSVKVFPIPVEADNNLNVKVTSIDKSIVKINVIDMTGKVQTARTILPVSDYINEKIDVTNLSTGMYQLEVTNGQGRQVIKFTK